jgi:predicted PurR-regulated permease PerM
VAIDLTPEQRSARDIVRSHILFFFGVLLFLLLAWLLVKELLIIYVSALFAVVLMPAVTRITSATIRGRNPSRPAAIILLVTSVALVIGTFFIVGLPPVLHDLNAFSTELPARIPRIVDRIGHLPIAKHLNVNSVAQQAEGTLTSSASYLLGSLPNWIKHLFDILTALFLCIYFMLEGEHSYLFFLSLFPPIPRRRLDVTLRRAEHRISKWLLGQGLLMVILGVCSTIVFGLLHVRYFVLLGFLMGLLNIIPIAGGVFTIALAAIVAALDSWTKMFAVIGFYLVYVNIENAFLTPRIMRSSVDLMGLTILVALLCGTALAGIVGALVAVPTAVLVVVLLDEYAVRKERPIA